MCRSIEIGFVYGAGWTQFCGLSLEVSLQSSLEGGFSLFERVQTKNLKIGHFGEISTWNQSENA